MKKIALLGFVGVSLFSMAAEAAVTVRYYNRDSQKYSFDAKCSGSTYKANFDGSTTSSTTIQGSGPCEVKDGSGKTVTLKGGENIEIEKGAIKVK
jgi:hypothetical protein